MIFFRWCLEYRTIKESNLCACHVVIDIQSSIEVNRVSWKGQSTVFWQSAVASDWESQALCKSSQTFWPQLQTVVTAMEIVSSLPWDAEKSEALTYIQSSIHYPI